MLEIFTTIEKEKKITHSIHTVYPQKTHDLSTKMFVNYTKLKKPPSKNSKEVF